MRLPDQINETSSHHVNGITYFTLPIEPTLHEELIRQLKELIDGDLPHMERIVGCIPTGDVSVGGGRSEERRVRSEWSSDVCSSDLDTPRRIDSPTEGTHRWRSPSHGTDCRLHPNG